jgi:protein O-mannosyl-transferase
MKTISLRALSPCFLALFLYANTLDYDFSYDDRGIVLENSDIQLLNWSRLLASSYWGESEDGLYRPLTMLSYGVNQFFDGGARYFHAVNAALHAVNVFLLYLFVGRHIGDKHALWTALCFAANPLLSEAVASIVGRAELLSFCFGLMGWIVWDIAKEKERIYWLLVAGVILLLSQLAKETGVVFAVAILVADWKREAPFVATALIPLVACCSGLLLKLWAIGTLSPRAIGFIDNPLAYADAAVRMANGLAIYIRYLIKIVYPWHLSADYSFDQISVIDRWYAGEVWLALALLCSILFFLLRWCRRNPFALRWTVAASLSLFIVSSIPTASSTIFAERLLYFPTAFYALLLSDFILRMRLGQNNFLLIALVGGCALLTLDRIRVWENDSALFRSAVQTSPRSARSHYGLGVSLHRASQWGPALASYDKALEIYPRYADAQYNRAALLLGQGKLEEAYKAYGEVVEWNPGYVKARRALALIEIERGQIEKGIERLYELARQASGAEEAYESLVLVLLQLGRQDEAERVWADGVRALPDNTLLQALRSRVARHE